MKEMRVIGPGPGRRAPTVRGRLLGLVDRGLSLRQPVAQLFAAFMAVPAQAALDVALKLAEAFGRTGIQLLTVEQRAALSLQVGAAALALGPDVATALGRVPPVEEATSVKAEALTTRMQQEEELVGLRRGTAVAQAAVGDARMELQAWQYEAQRRMTEQLFREFVSAPTLEERVQIAGDAGPALDALEKEIEALRATRAQNAAEAAALKAQLDEVESDTEMLRTMRAVADGQDVDEGLMARMARYYAERVPQGPGGGGTGAGGGATGKVKATGKGKKTPGN